MRKKASKLLSVLLSLVFMAGLLPTVAPIHAHAEPPDDQCPSPYSSDGHHDWRVISSTDSTCTAAGSMTWQCYDCDRTYTESVPALGHSWGAWLTRTEPTCTRPGNRVRQCSRCGAWEEDAIQPLGHAYNAAVTKEATCTATGVRTYTCTRCGDSYTEAIAALGHSWDGGTVTKAATCEAAGTMTYKCTRCGETRTETIPALGHAWDAGTVTKEPTCTAEGTRSFTCQNDRSHTRTETIPALGHDYVTEITREPTCTEAGEQVETCSHCGDRKVTTLEPLGHDWDYGETTEPQGLTDGQTVTTCRRCGETEIQTIPAAPSMFNLLRNVPPSAAQAGDLVVTLQPEGGAIPANGSLILTTAVEGGVAPYTYEWHRENNFNEAAPLFQAKADAFAESYNSNKAGFAAAFQSVINQGRVEGTIDRHTEAVPMTSTFSFGSTMYNKGLEPVRLNLNDHSLGESESPDYPATAPGSYYCVIRDSAGHWVSTENAEVVYGLYIITQPHNVNISAGDSFSILAAGGTPPYTYQWGYSLGDNGAMNPINGATGEYYAPTAGMDGDFICLVVDANDSVVRSNVVTAYSADPLVISSITPPSTMEAGEITRLEATVMGGVPPYIGVWNGFGVDGVADGDLTKYAMMADDFGTYTFSVTDAMGQVQIGTTTVEEANGGTDEAEPQKVTEDGKPIITRQPKSMTLGYREDGNYSGILTCEAISAVSGDDSTLEYQWEGCDPTYGWLSIYKGKNMPISSAFMGFPFRCKVTDRETGENVYSDIATAQVGLSIDSITWAGNHGGGLYNEFHVYSMGGSGPYTLQVFLLTPVDYNDTVYDSYYYQHKGEYIEALFETHTFDDNANYYSLHLPRYQTVTYMKDGHYVSENILAHYRCVITDSLGKTVSEDFD